MMHANNGQAMPNFQYQSTFKAELALARLLLIGNEVAEEVTA